MVMSEKQYKTETWLLQNTNRKCCILLYPVTL